MSTRLSQQTENCILCVGMCVLDVIHLCAEFPTEDTDKRCLSGYWQRGGNCSNICTVLRQLNANCEFFGMLSSSPGFAVLLQDCHSRGIEIKNCPTTTQDPPFSSIILSKAMGSRTIIHSNNNFPILTYEDFCKLDLARYTWIHFEARNPKETMRMIHDICAYNKKVCCNNNSSERRIKISLDLEKLREDFIFLAEYVDYVFLGKDLAKHLGWKNPNIAVHELRSKLKTQTNTEHRKPNIICPWGGQSVGFLNCDDEFGLLPVAAPAEIVDTLGAGDTFCAATVHALHVLQKNLKDAIDFGIHCAGFKIAHRGYDDIKQFYLSEISSNA